MKSPPVPRADAWLLALLVVLVAGLLAAATAQVAGFDFLLWDDDRILGSLAARDTAFPSRYDWLMDPLTTTLTSPVAVGVWGLLADSVGVTARSFHLLGLLLHAANVVLVALACRALLRFTGRDSPDASTSAWMASACAAALWGLHPVRAEVIGWVAATPYALATALALASLLAFLGVEPGEGWRPRARLVAAWSLFLAANLAHPYVAPLSLVFYLLDRGYRPETVRHADAIRWASSHLPFHGATAFVSAWSVLMGILLRTGAGGGAGSASGPSGAALLLQQIQRVLGFTGHFSLGHAWLRLKTVVVPPAYDAATWSSPTFVLGLLVLGALFVVARRRAPRSPGLAIALAAHVVFAVPASGPFVQKFSLGDRYVYGITVIAAAVGAFLFLALLERARQAFVARALLVAGVLAASGLAAQSLSTSVGKWRDTVRLMEDLVATGPGLHWRLAAGLRIADYWNRQGDQPRARSALLRVVEIPGGTAEERFSKAVGFMVQRGYCAEAAYVVEAPIEALPAPARDALRARVPDCYRGVAHR